MPFRPYLPRWPCWYAILEAGYQGVPDVGTREPARALEAGCSYVWSVAQQRADPLIVDGIGPLGAIEVRYREFEQEIAQRCRVEDRGVEKRNCDRQRSIAHVEFLGVGGQLVERPAPSGIRFVLVAEDVVEAHAAVRPDLVEGNGAVFKEADQEGARDIEKVGRFLGRQFGVLAEHCDSAAGSDVLKDFNEKRANRRGQFNDIVTVRTGDPEHQGAVPAQERG